MNFNQPDQKRLEAVSVAEMKDYIAQDQFAKGSMLPKVQAAIDFVESRPESSAVITSLENVGRFLEKGDGTIISMSPVPSQS